jgi:hypothetical protein
MKFFWKQIFIVIIFLLANSCIEIIPNHIHVTIEEPIHLVCRIHSIENPNEVNFHVEWTRNDYLLNNLTELISNYSSIDGILYESLMIKSANRTDTGIYKCRYGELLTATAQVIVNQCRLSVDFYCKIWISFFF